MSPTLLTTVIVAYRNDEALSQCLSALELATPKLGHEIVVVDNGSQTSTRDVVEASLTGATYIDPGRNLGFGRASNIGSRRAQGAFLLFLNPDTIVPSNGLTEACAALAARPDVGILGCTLRMEDGAIDHACKRAAPDPLGALAYFLKLDRFAAVRRRFGSYQTLDTSDTDEAYVDAVNGAFMLMRRDFFEELGHFDEAFWMYGEDLDLCRRSIAIGRAVLYWPGLTVLHAKGGTTGRRRSLPVNVAFHRAMWLYYAKHLSDQHSRITNGIIWLGIHARLVVSASRSLLVGVR